MQRLLAKIIKVLFVLFITESFVSMNLSNLCVVDVGNPCSSPNSFRFECGERLNTGKSLEDCVVVFSRGSRLLLGRKTASMSEATPREINQIEMNRKLIS